LLSLFVLVTVGTVSFASLGLVVASVTNTMQETQVLNQLLWLPLIFLSGATLPIAYLPKIAQSVAVFLPATYLVTGLQGAMYSSFPVWKLLTQILALALWTILTFFVAAQLFSLGARVQNPAQRQALGSRHRSSLFSPRVWENKNGQILTQAQAAYRSLDRSPSTDQSKPNSPSMGNLPKSKKDSAPQQ